MNTKKIYFATSVITIIIALLIRYILNINPHYVGLLMCPLIMSFIYANGKNMKSKYLYATSSVLIAFLFWGEFEIRSVIFALSGCIASFTSIFLTEHFSGFKKNKKARITFWCYPRFLYILLFLLNNNLIES